MLKHGIVRVRKSVHDHLSDEKGGRAGRLMELVASRLIPRTVPQDDQRGRQANGYPTALLRFPHPGRLGRF